MMNPMMMFGMMGGGMNPGMNQGMGLNPGMNPGINAGMYNAGMNPMAAGMMQVQNAHMMTFNPLITEDYKIAKIMEINNRLSEWNGINGYFELGVSRYANNNQNYNFSIDANQQNINNYPKNFM